MGLLCLSFLHSPNRGSRNIGLDLSSELDSQCDLKAIDPIGSMYAIYGNIYHQYTPFMLAYMPYMDPMGILWPSIISRWYPVSNNTHVTFTPSQSWRKLKVLHVAMTDPWCWYINANIKGVYWWDPWHTIYSSTMDPMGYKVMIFSSPRFEDVGEYVGHALAFWCTVWDPKYLDGKRHTQPFLNPPKPAHACPICCWWVVSLGVWMLHGHLLNRGTFGL